MRNRETSSYRALAGYLGFSLMCVGGIMLLPLLVLPAFPDEIGQAPLFVIPGGISIAIGYVMSFVGRGRRVVLARQQDAVLVVAFWACAIVLCSLPFFISGNYTFAQSVFETTSGWSTTGLSIVNVEKAPKILLMYRSVLQFFGGIGIVLVMSTILAGSGGMQLFNAEGHSDRLVPNLLESARAILLIYSGIILSGIILYMLLGMDWFDSINHSIAAVSTGGFSTRAASIAYYNSPAIELVTILLMILGNIGFASHILLFRGQFRKYVAHDEFLFFAFLLAVTIPAAAFLLLKQFALTMGESFRVAAFQVVSALTTTGFQTVPTFNDWSPALTALMIALMLIGGGIGSTAGGIKQYRVIAMLRTVFWTIRDLLAFPGEVHYDRMVRPLGDEAMDYRAKTQISSFVALYLAVYGIGVFALCALGASLPDAMFEFSSALGTVGLSRGIMVADAQSAVLWIGSFGMFFGRLEMFVVLIACNKVWTDIRGKRRT